MKNNLFIRKIESLFQDFHTSHVMTLCTCFVTWAKEVHSVFFGVHFLVVCWQDYAKKRKFGGKVAWATKKSLDFGGRWGDA